MNIHIKTNQPTKDNNKTSQVWICMMEKEWNRGCRRQSEKECLQISDLGGRLGNSCALVPSESESLPIWTMKCDTTHMHGLSPSQGKHRKSPLLEIAVYCLDCHGRGSGVSHRHWDEAAGEQHLPYKVLSSTTLAHWRMFRKKTDSWGFFLACSESSGCGVNFLISL